MLSDHEQKTLREIRHRLDIDDPDFERPFQALDKATPVRHRWGYTAVVVSAVFLAVLMLLAGSPGGAFAFGLVAGSVRLAQYFHDTAAGEDR